MLAEKKTRGKKIMGRTLFGAVLGMALAGGVLFGWNHYTSPKACEARELDGLAKQIIPEYAGQRGRTQYSLSDERNISVMKGPNDDERECYNRLKITVNGEVRFVSERWGSFPDGDARNLDKLFVQGREGWQMFEMEELDNPSAWADVYHELIREVAGAEGINAYNARFGELRKKVGRDE